MLTCEVISVRQWLYMFPHSAGSDRGSSGLVPFMQLCRHLLFSFRSHGREEAMCVALCCLHKISISSSLFSNMKHSFSSIAEGIYFSWIKGVQKLVCLFTFWECIWPESISVALSAVVESYLNTPPPPLHSHKHNDMASASVQEGINSAAGQLMWM